MPKRQLMAEEWNKFSAAYLKNASPIQRKEMRRAFYAGAQSLLFVVMASLSPESEPTEADLQAMSDLDNELQEFAQGLTKGIN